MTRSPPVFQSYSIASNRNGSVIAVSSAGENPLGGGEDEDDDGKGKMPCLNCRLIQMGSAISYGDNRCPQCGRDIYP